MQKLSFDLSKLQAIGLGAGILGAGGTAGFLLERARAKHALAAQNQAFADFNKREIQAVADDAFSEGVEFAAANLGKTSSLHGILVEIEKDAAAKDKLYSLSKAIKGIHKQAGAATEEAIGAAKNIFGSGFKMRSAAHAAEAAGTPITDAVRSQYRQEIAKNLLAGGAVLGGAGLVANKIVN